MTARRFRVTGRVQGVGFRAYVLGVANDLGCAGEIWNCRDGGVEGVVGGASEAVEEFVRLLEHGPGWVQSVVVELNTLQTPVNPFSIGRTR